MKGFVALILLVLLAASAIGLYSLFNSQEVHKATGEAIVAVGDGLHVALIGIGVGVCVVALGWAVARTDKGRSQRHLINAMSKGGVLQEPHGEHWHVFNPRAPTIAERHQREYVRGELVEEGGE